MTRPWEAERSLDAARARVLIRARFPTLVAASVEPLGRGWDNTAFLVDGSIVVRFPRKSSTVALLEAETRFLEAVGDRLPLPVPRPEFVAREGPDYPWPFVGYRLVAGRTACRADLDVRARVALAPSLGGFLRALHGIVPPDVGLPGDDLGRLRLDRRVEELEARLSALAARGALTDATAILDTFVDLGPDRSADPAPVVVHGDLYARHLLVDSEARLVGVIDWGDVHLGSRATDLMVLYAFLPPGAREGFLRAYGPIADDELRSARRRALFHSTAVAWFGAEVNDHALAREGLAGVRNALHGVDDA